MDITVIACCNTAGRFVLPVLIFKGVNTKREFGDSLPYSDVYMNRKSLQISTSFFIRRSTEHFLKTHSLGKAILPSDGHEAYYNSPLLLHSAVEINVIIIRLPDQCTHTLQLLDSAFLGLQRVLIKNEAAGCRINRYHTARLISLLEVKLLLWVLQYVNGYLTLEQLEYFFPISDTGETLTSIQKNFQIWIPFVYPLLQ